MKRTFILIILIAFAANTCAAQWRNIGLGNPAGGGGNLSVVIAWGVHDTSLFASIPASGSGPANVGRYVPSTNGWTYAAKGINFSQGNVTSFASLGRFFIAGVANGLNYTSTNNGSTWTVNDTIGSPVGTNGKYLFAVDAKGIARSTDSGNTWETTGNNLSPGIYAANGAYIFASTASGISRSTNSGMTWSSISSTLIQNIPSFALLGTILFAVNVPDVNFPGNMIVSTDSGESWAKVNNPLGGVNALAVSGLSLFAGGGDGVWASLDSGKTWKDVSDGLGGGHLNGSKNVISLCVFDTMLFAGIEVQNLGVGCGTARPISELVQEAKSAVNETPASLTTLSVFPNPLGNSATILYSIPAQSFVSIT